MKQTIGCDIMAIDRVDWAGLQADDPFVKATFSAGEWRRAQVSEDSSHVLAEAFAVKEAVFKSLHLDDDAIVRIERELDRRSRFCDIEVVYEHAWPEVKVPSDLACCLGLERVSISLSFDAGIVFATALAEWK